MLDEAIAKLDEAMADTELCLRCRWDREFREHGSYSPFIGSRRSCAPTRAHSCTRVRAAVRDVALAVANWPTEAELDSCQIGATAESEINRLLPEGSEGGK